MKPVIIVGAGPVGCTAALYLAKNNIPVLLLEAQPDLPVDLRASTFHPPTLDMLADLGITETMIEQGLIVPNYQYRDRQSDEVADFQMYRLHDDTKHPFRLQCEQWKMTRISVAELEKYPHAEVRYGEKLVGFKQETDGVTILTYSSEHGERQESGSYLIGTDGADSVVRRAGAVKFEGLTYPERFLVASTPFKFEDHFDNLAWVNYVSDPEEWCVLLKTVDFWRVLVPTPIEAKSDRLLSDAYIEDRLQRLVPSSNPYEIVHRTLYRVHQRVAETYRVREDVLIAGDAAHINNPLGGMGMNGGIHDAINLSEKLVAIINNGADKNQMLDLYDRQRRGICLNFIQKHTMKNKALMEATDSDTQRKRQNRFMEACSDPDLERNFLLETSMINALQESYAIG